jgi:hypothetical protein
LGSALVYFGKYVFTPEHQRAATKGDLKNLEAKLVKRYHLIKNINPDSLGRQAYFDIRHQVLVYLNPNVMY